MSQVIQKAAAFRCRNRSIEGQKPWVMGILNVTPDSFSDGGLYADLPLAKARISELLQEGADVLDIGGESTRPGSEPVDAATELARIVPVVEAALEAGAIVSVDTQKPEVAREALRRGAHLVNDVSGLGEAMLEVVAEFSASAIVMHMQGKPAHMQDDPRYVDPVREVGEFLRSRVEAAEAAAVPVFVDPGIGFGKGLRHNLALLAHLDELRRHAPLLLGASRKSFLRKLTEREADERLAGSLTVGTWAMSLGVDMLRVHDVREHVDARRVWGALQEQRQSTQATPTHRQIEVTGLTLSCHIGVPEAERARRQPVVCDFRLRRRAAAAHGEEDRLSTTADYSQAIECVREAAESQPRRLLETLAEALVAVLEARFVGWQAEVEVGKPEIAQQLGASTITVRHGGE